MRTKRGKKMATSTNGKLKVYLAGDISKERWRIYVIDKCNDFEVEWLSPIDNISYSYQSLISQHRKKRVFHIADKLKVDRADIVFAYIADDSPSRFSGTSWELGYAYAKGKHTILVCDMKPSEECLYELVKRMSDAYYRTMDEGIDHLRELAFEMKYLPRSA